MNKSYGICYMGSKNLIAENIIARLPKCDTFIDLFGGGGAMTHYACLSNKFKHFVYNDKNKMIYELFKQAVNASFDFDFNNYPWIDKEKYYTLRYNHPYYTFTYSFNGQGDWYGFSDKNMYNDSEMYQKYGKLPAVIKQRNFRLNALRELKKYGITILNLDYEEALNDIINVTDYYTPADYSLMIYCDIPYENTEKYIEGVFDNKRFYDFIYQWGLIHKQYIVVSSYNINDDRFKEYASIVKCVNYGSKQENVDEKLYVSDYLLDKIKNNSNYQLSIFDLLDNK